MNTLLLLLTLTCSTPENNVVDLPPDQTAKHVGKNANVCGKISEIRIMGSTNKFMLLCLGGTYPNQAFTVRIDLEDTKTFNYRPEQYLKNKSVCVTGKIIENNGKTEMVIDDQDDIRVNENTFEIRANNLDAFNKYFDEK